VSDDDVHKLIDEQKNDETLSDCRNMAHRGKGNYVISRGLLYHKEKVEGQFVCQLCVPVGRRDAVLKLAHDLVYSGHLGERKTSRRIRLSFYWPSLKRSVSEYVRSCQTARLHAS